MTGTMGAWPMVSKWGRCLTLWGAILALTLGGGGLSCTPKLGEEAPPPQQQTFSGTACLTEASEVIEKFFRGSARNDQVAEAWSCMSGALRAFEKYVRGRSTDSYTAAELANFIETEFIARRTDGSIHAIPPALQTEMMKVKTLLVGGSTERISRDEIRSLISQFDRFKRLSLALNPYMKVYLQMWKPDIQGELSPTSDLKYFEEATEKLRNAAQDFGALIEANQSSYRLDDATLLLRELSTYVGRDWGVTASLERFMPLAKKVKKTLAGGREDMILSNEWRLVLVTALRSYSQYLRYYYFVDLPPTVGREQRLTAFSRMIEDSLGIMEDLVKDKPSRQIARAELDEVLIEVNRAWPSFKYSAVLIDELMKIKTLLFGGTFDRVAFSDFQNARLKVVRVRSLLAMLAPYARIYSGTWTGGEAGGTEQTRKEFDQAGTALQKAFVEFGGLLELQNAERFDLRGFRNLVKELNRLYPGGTGRGILEGVDDYYLLIEALKNMTYGTRDHWVQKDQWPSLLMVGAKIYLIGLYGEYFFEHEQLAKPQTIRALNHIVQESVTLSEEMLALNPKKYFPRTDIAKVLEQAVDLGFLPEMISRSMISDLLRPVLNRLLTPPDRRLSGERPDAYRASSAASLRSEFEIWSESAIFLAETFGGDNEKTLRSAELRGAIGKKLNNKATAESLRIGLQELDAIFNTNQSLVLDREKRLYLSAGGRLKYNLRSVERHNLIRAISRLFIASYANEKSRIRRYQGVTLGEANLAFKDFRAVGVAAGVLDPNSLKFMNSRFMEANLFMPRSNGDKLASFLETHEIVYSILSGLVLNSKLQKELQRCPGSKKGLVSIDCMYGAYLSRFDQHMASLPDLLRYRKSLTNEQFSAYFWNTLTGSGWVPNAERVVSASDASLQPQLWQYIELVFVRFDTNADNVIDTEEALKAFPVFRQLFLEVAAKDLAAGRITEAELPALFMYILKYGRPPSGIWEGLTRWYPWRRNPSKWDVRADRGLLASVLDFIAKEMNGQSLIEPGPGYQH